MGPRDVQAGFPVPVNYETGKTLTERQQRSLEALSEAAEGIYEAMHHAEGTTPPGEHQDHTWSSRRMSIAATHIETALFFARRAALEAP